MLSLATSSLHRHLPRIRRRLPNNNRITPYAFFSTRSTRKTNKQSPGPLSSSLSSSSSSSSSSRRTGKNNNSADNNAPPLPASSSSSGVSTQIGGGVVDWREWFRSSDYDNPYSPHISHTTHTETTSTSTTASSSSPLSSSSDAAKQEYQNNLLQSINDGTWRRRRHGLNLEPLVIYDVDVDGDGERTKHIIDEEYDIDTGEEELMSEEEEEEAMQQQSAEQGSEEEASKASRANNNNNTRQRLQWMDAQTRFLCRMLDDLYRTGIRRETDRPRTERCHRAIGRLLSMTPLNPPRRHEPQLENIVSGLAQRAGGILQRMEQCSPPALVHKPSKSKDLDVDVASAAKESDAPLSSSSSSLDNLIFSTNKETTELSYQNAYTHPRHLENAKYALPAPTRAIYNMALLSFSKESGPASVGQQAEDVVWGMIERGLQVWNNNMQQGWQRIESRDDHSEQSGEEGKQKITDIAAPLLLLPTAENWNCVLKCWSRSTDPDRAFYAYSFALSWMEWSGKEQQLQQRQYQSESESESRGRDLQSSGGDNDELLQKNTVVDDVDYMNMKMNIAHPDVESYRLILQSCLAHNEEFHHEAEFERAKEMGSGVAIRLWKEMLSTPKMKMELDAATYSEVLRAICLTSELPSASSKIGALQALARVFARCCQDGMVTDEILEIVEASTTKSQFLQLKAKMDSV